MLEVGIRELKMKLSYYVQLMESGELIRIKVRNRIVGFLSNMMPQLPKKPKKIQSKKLLQQIEKWRAEGLLLNGGLCKSYRIQPIELKGDKTTLDLLQQIRNENR